MLVAGDDRRPRVGENLAVAGPAAGAQSDVMVDDLPPRRGAASGADKSVEPQSKWNGRDASEDTAETEGEHDDRGNGGSPGELKHEAVQQTGKQEPYEVDEEGNEGKADEQAMHAIEAEVADYELFTVHGSI